MSERRKVVKIDSEKCNGCGECVSACAEGAIRIEDGKARLVSETYCDGLGNCLGTCPEGAISIEEREAPAFDEEATREHVSGKKSLKSEPHRGCPGSMVRTPIRANSEPGFPPIPDGAPLRSQLTNWPVQLKLVPIHAPYLRDADLLLTADCVPFALADFHSRFLQGKPVLIACPKLDDASFYVDKLSEILREGSIRSLTVVHMEVPCCSGLTRIAEMALARSGKQIPLRDVTVSIGGEVLSEVSAPQGT